MSDFDLCGDGTRNTTKPTVTLDEEPYREWNIFSADVLVGTVLARTAEEAEAKVDRAQVEHSPMEEDGVVKLLAVPKYF